MQRQLASIALAVLALLSVDSLVTSRDVAFRSSPSMDNDVAQLPSGRVASLHLGSSSSWGALPMIGRSRHTKTQRRAMTLGSRLEPAAGAQLTPGVKAMRYGRRSQDARP